MPFLPITDTMMERGKETRGKVARQRQKSRLGNERNFFTRIEYQKSFAREAERDNSMRSLKVSPLVSNGIATRFQFRLNNDFHLSLPPLGPKLSRLEMERTPQTWPASTN